MRFRYVILLTAILVVLNIFNFTWWSKNRHEEKSMSKLPSILDQGNAEHQKYIYDEDAQLFPSQNYVNAASAFIKKEFEIAINELNADLQIYPNHAQAYFLLGKIYEDATFPDGKYFSKMANNFEKYIELKPDGYKAEHAKLKMAQYFISIGLMQQNTELLDKAEKYLKSIDQNNGEVRMGLGAIYLDRSNFAQAISEFEKSANLQENELRIKYNSLGLAYIKTGRYGNAEKVLKIAIQIEPNNKFAHNNLGFVYLRLKRFKDAELQFKEALLIDPSYKNARENLNWLDSLNTK